jgi:glycosyltransferase involved in cell wall biosynthesis
MKTRVALLSNYPSDHHSFSGGVETATAALLEGLCAHQNEFEFHIIALAKSTSKDVIEARDGFIFHFLGIPNHLLLRPRLPFRIVKTYRALRRLQPDLIHCQDNMALALAAILSSYPRVFTIHGVKRAEASKRTGWEYWSAHADARLESLAHRHFDAVICISEYAARVAGEKAATFAIPNAVSSIFFQTCRKTVASNPRLLFVGVLAPLKRPGDLLQVHAELRREYPNLETLFCGDVEDEGYARALRQRVLDAKIEGVRWMGRVSREELAQLLSTTTALVLPSTQENAPMVIAEAMAVGVPVVATRVGGVPEMVRDTETGFLYDIGNIPVLTSSLRRMLTDSNLCERMGHRARALAQAKYSTATVAAATAAVYRELLAPRMVTAGGQVHV